jgi:DNA polymerase-3 subunit gamma/tau
LASEADTDDLLRLHQGFAQGFDDVVRSGQPRAALEMLLVRLSRRPALVPIDLLVQRLGQLERRLGGNQAHAAGPRPAPNAGGAAGGGGQPMQARNREQRSAPSPRPEKADDRKEPPGGSAPPGASGSSRPFSRDGTARSAAPAPLEAPPQDLEEILRGIVARIASERPELAAKLEHGVPLENTPGRFVIGWAPGSLFGELVGSPESTAIVEKAATALLGTPTRVEHEHESSRAAGKKTLSNLEVEARERRTRETYERLKQHPRIADAVEIFGARLKELKLAKAH